jgi:hypothetical protein
LIVSYITESTEGTSGERRLNAKSPSLSSIIGFELKHNSFLWKVPNLKGTTLFRVKDT